MKLFQRKTLDNVGFDLALHSFHKASSNVPAYADFLRINGIDHTKIRSQQDFKSVPIVTKENYLTQYPFKDLLDNGSLLSANIVSMSSGSSGMPFFWPRNEFNAAEAVEMFRCIFNEFDTLHRTSLVVIAFAMGNWIAGTYSLEALQTLQAQGHKLTIMTPGLDATAITRIFAELGQVYDQVIILGYPPFVKDSLMNSKELMGVRKFSKIDLKVVMAGENISEQWRDYLLANFVSSRSLQSTCLIYGTADAGVMGHETPQTIAFRKLLNKSSVTVKNNFLNFSKNNTIPTIVKYYPEYKYFEQLENYLIFTYYGALPLIRYKINDIGLVLNPTSLKNEHPEVHQKLIDSRLENDHIIMLASRSDVSTTFYALDIFPENVKYTLEKGKYSKMLNGKFFMTTEFDEDQNQTLHLYLQANEKKSDKLEFGIEELTKDLVKGLKKLNGEYNRLYQELGKRAEPKVHILAHNDESFSFKIKNKWVR